MIFPCQYSMKTQFFLNILNSQKKWKTQFLKTVTGL